MKKLGIFALILLLIFGLVACGAPDTGDTQHTSDREDGTTTPSKEGNTKPNPATCEHVPGEATCTVAARCTLCGRYIGIPLGHDWNYVTSSCSRCGRADSLAKKEEGITRVVCVGDSITEYNPYWENNMLGKLDESYEVIGLGVSGSTGLASGIDGTDPKGYVIQDKYTQSLRYNPDIVVIMLGTNDTKPVNSDRIYADGGAQFKADMTAMVKAYQSLSADPQIYIALPATIYRDRNYASGINDGDLVDLIIPLLREVATENGCTVIDVHTATQNCNAHFTDGVHPTGEEGRNLIATPIAEAILKDRG